MLKGGLQKYTCTFVCPSLTITLKEEGMRITLSSLKNSLPFSILKKEIKVLHYQQGRGKKQPKKPK